MTYEEARKAVISQRKENYFLICFGYSEQCILPFKEGLALLAALENAETMKNRYGAKEIIPLPVDYLQVTTIPVEDYRNIKMAALMGITYDELMTSLGKKGE